MQNTGFHSITIAGRAGQDPTVHYYESGTVRATFTIVLRSRDDDGGINHFPVEIWGKQAQIAADHVRQGSSVGVVGRLRRLSAEEETYVQVEHLEMLDITTPDFNN